MSSDSDTMQTPVAMRRAVKMVPNLRAKSLNISKILGKMKNSTNYSGYSSSFNKDSISTDFMKIDDDLFPEDKENEEMIERKIKEKRREITEKSRLSPKKVTKEPDHVPAEEPVTPIPVKAPLKKRRRPKKAETDNKSTTSKPKQKSTRIDKPKTDTKEIPVKKATKPLAAKKPKETKNKKRKPKEVEDHSSSISLFEVLNFDEKSDNEKEDEVVFILESPVKKKRKTRQPKKPVSNTRKRSKISLASDPFEDNNFDAISSDDEAIKARVELEKKAKVKTKADREKENKKRIDDLKRNAEDEKLRLKQKREAEKEMEKVKLEEQIRLKKEQQIKETLKKEKRQKRIEMLEKIKESVSQAIADDETVMVPLRDEDERDVSTNKINVRRASLASRGKRLSSVGNGFIGTPHSEIPDNELHKHLDIDLPDSYKLRNLLIWIGKRLLKDDNDQWMNEVLEKFENDEEIIEQLKGLSKTVLNQLIEDLSHGKVKVDWWGDQNTNHILSSTDKPILMKKNKENVENAKNLEFYQSEIKKLQREMNIWNSISEHTNISETDKVLAKLSQIEIVKHSFITEEEKTTQQLIDTGYSRVRKLDRLMKRKNSTDEIVEKVMYKRTKKIVEQLKRESACDALSLLRRLR